MKKLIFLPFILSALILNAQQWGGSTTTSNLIYRPGQVLVGGTTLTGSFGVNDGLIEIQSPLNNYNLLSFRNGTDNTNVMDMVFNSSCCGYIGTRNVPFSLIMNGTERFRINTNGNIGIGTTTPSTNFEINSSVSNVSGLKFTQLTSSSTTASNNGKTLSIDATGNIILTTAGGNGGGDWSLTGNAGTIDGTNFIGTTDNKPFNIRVNNLKSGRIDPILRNAFFGNEAATNTTTGTDNTGIGSRGVLDQNTTGSSNTAVGSFALSLNTTAGNNTALGTNTSPTNTFISSSTAIGAGALVNLTSKIRLGNTTTTTVETQLNYSTVSDGRFKYNISESDVKGLEFINLLRPVVYNFDTKKFQEFLTQNMPESMRRKYFENQDFNTSSSIRQTGFIAQEVEKAAHTVGYNFNAVHVPEAKDDNYSLAYSEFVVPLVKAVQELSKQNEELKKEMNELKALIKANSNIEGFIKISESNATAQLFQNIPNPFNQSTIIKYSIPSTAKRAMINIISSGGTKMKEFDLKSKAGHSIEISGGQLSPGAYIYSLIVDDVLIDSKQMILTN